MDTLSETQQISDTRLIHCHTVCNECVKCFMMTLSFDSVCNIPKTRHFFSCFYFTHGKSWGHVFCSQRWSENRHERDHKNLHNGSRENPKSAFVSESQPKSTGATQVRTAPPKRVLHPARRPHPTWEYPR